MEISEIKQELTLAQVLDYYHLKPNKQLLLNCPFHEDKTPSLQIYYKTHTAYCFSSNCKTHGKSLDVIDFIMHKENITKKEAIEKAKELIGGTTKREPSKTEVLTKMFAYFQNATHNSKPARLYIEKRGLNHTNTAIGYNSGQFHHGARKKADLIKYCLDYGLLIDLKAKSRTGNPAYKPFGKNCIVFPLKNDRGQIVSLYFRSILDNKNQRHFYLKDRAGLYPHYPSIETKKLILTESIIDAATLLEQENITKQYEVLALYGTNGLTKWHLEAIKQLTNLEEIIFFLNGDQPGIKAVEKYASILKSELAKVKISQVEVPQDEDVNSLLQGHNKEILTHLIESRKEHNILLSTEQIEPVTNIQVSTQNIELKTNNSLLNTVNPHNLKYQGSAANYQIKGFKMNQLDSLKITLNIAVK